MFIQSFAFYPAYLSNVPSLHSKGLDRVLNVCNFIISYLFLRSQSIKLVTMLNARSHLSKKDENIMSSGMNSISLQDKENTVSSNNVHETRKSNGDKLNSSNVIVIQSGHLELKSKRKWSLTTELCSPFSAITGISG